MGRWAVAGLEQAVLGFLSMKFCLTTKEQDGLWQERVTHRLGNRSRGAPGTQGFSDTEAKARPQARNTLGYF